MYDDVPQNSKFYDAIVFVSRSGLMIGNVKGNFNPSSTVSWGEAFVLLYNFIRDHTELPDKYDPNFEKWYDHDNPDFSWCKQYIYYFINKKLAPNKKFWTKQLDKPISLFRFILFLEAVDDDLVDLSKHLPHNFESEKQTRENIAFIIYTAVKIKASLIEPKIKDDLNNGNYLLALEKIRHNRFYYPCFHPDFAQMIGLVFKAAGNSELYIEYTNKLLLFKQSLQLDKSKAEPIYHYTSLATLENLSSGSKFRAYHTEYLNDPNEGNRIISLLDSYNLGQRYPGWTPLKEQSSGVFLVSFISNSNDSLPMWSQYGGQYAGCCLEFDPSSIPYELYDVIYDEDTFKCYLEAIFQILDEYKIALSENKISLDVQSDPVFLFAQDILNFIRYLYKDPAFKNEQEVRLLIFDDLRSAYAEDKIRPGESFPRIFKEINLPRLDEHIATSPVSIQRIYLGPKVYKPNWVKISLVQRNYPASRIEKSAVELQ